MNAIRCQASSVHGKWEEVQPKMAREVLKCRSDLNLDHSSKLTTLDLDFETGKFKTLKIVGYRKSMGRPTKWIIMRRALKNLVQRMQYRCV